MFDIVPAIKDLSTNKIGPALTILQLTLTLAIVCNALYFIQQRALLIMQPTGMAENEVFTVFVRGTNQDFDLAGVVEQDMKLIRSIPGVVGAAPLSSIPLSSRGSRYPVSNFPKVQKNKDTVSTWVNYFVSGGKITEALGLRLIAGRDFASDDYRVYESYSRKFPPAVTIVTKTLARKLFGEENAIGKNIYIAGDNPVEVIGIVEDFLGSWVNWNYRLNVIFFPGLHNDQTIHYMIRAEESRRAGIMSDLMPKLLAINNQRLLRNMQPISFYKKRAYRNDIAMIKILAIVVISIIVINVFGIIGLITFLINRRRKQIGIRRALGASSLDVFRFFIVETGIICAVAIVLGSILAYSISNLLVQRFSLSPLPWYYLPIASIVLITITLAAAWWPAKRAAQIAPAIATRGE